MENYLKKAHAETAKIIEELLRDGSDPDALYLIEHHISSKNFAELENVAIEAFQLGYEVAEPEELLNDDEKSIFSFDIVIETPLDADLINEQISKIYDFIKKYNVDYDGWGTYYNGPGDNENESVSEDL